MTKDLMKNKIANVIHSKVVENLINAIMCIRPYTYIHIRLW